MNSNLSFQIPNSKLPRGWRWVKLGEVAKEFVNGGTPSTNIPEYWDGNIPWITGADVTDFWVSGGRKFITEDGLKNSVTHLVPRNTVLVVTRTGVGKIGIAANDLCFSQDITGVICSEEIYPEYLVWYIFSERNNLTNIQRGATIKGLTRNDIESLQIPLPPLEEQKSISLKIQELMQEVGRARTACEKQLEAAKALLAAFLREVFESEEAKKWERKRLGEVCEVVTGATPRTEEATNWNGEILWATPNDMGKLKGFTIEDTERKISKKGFESCSTKLLPPGSVLLTTRAPIGHLAINLKPMCTNQGFKSLIPISRIYNWFLFFALKHFVPVLQSMGRGQTFTEISKGQVETFEIPIPPLSEQHQISFYLKEKMAQVENIQSAIQNQQSALKDLPQAILRKAFSGEL